MSSFEKMLKHTQKPKVNEKLDATGAEDLDVNDKVWSKVLETGDKLELYYIPSEKRAILQVLNKNDKGGLTLIDKVIGPEIIDAVRKFDQTSK